MMNRSLRLETRITASFLLSTILPLLVVGTIFIWMFININNQSLQANQASMIEVAKENIDHYMSDVIEEMTMLGSMVLVPDVDWKISVQSFCRASKENFLSLAVTDLQGQEIYHLDNCNIASDAGLSNRKKEPAFLQAVERKIFIQSTPNGSLETPTAIVAVRTRAYKQDIVLIAQISMEPTWRSINNLSINNEGYIYIVDQNGKLIGFKDNKVLLEDRDVSNIPSVAALLKEKNGLIAQRYDGLLGANVIGTSAFMDQYNWGVVLEQPTSSVYAGYNILLLIIGLILLFFGIMAMVTSTILSRAIVTPLTKLAAGAQEIGRGNLNVSIDIQNNDEIGLTARAFNQMASQLKQILGGLEEKIQERTQDLENAQQQSEKRAASLQSITEISSAISMEQDVAKLLEIVPDLVSEKFDFYHVGIFLLDEMRRYAVLQATNSEGGKQMLAHQHKLEIGQTGLVGYVAQYGRARIASEVGKDNTYFNNPYLPETRSEMALPLRVRGNTIGVLDVQSKQSNAFSNSDISILNVLADQIATAIENARLFGQAQRALTEAESLYDQYLNQEWQKTLQDETKVGYRQTAMGGQAIEKIIQTPEIQRALKRGEIMIEKPVNAGEKEAAAEIVMPVKLRNQVIGVLNIKSADKDRNWTNDEINMVRLISERLALTLETARLFNDSQRRAAKEQIISSISSKISASINMRNVLQTTAEELGRALPGSEILIQFNQDQK